MNINNWLCKHFDGGKKGYVTIGDVSQRIIHIAMLFFCIIAIGLSGIVSFKVPQPNDPPNVLSFLGWVGGGWVMIFKYILIPVAIVISIFYIIYKVLNIKIAKCELKQKEQDKI